VVQQSDEELEPAARWGQQVRERARPGSIARVAGQGEQRHHAKGSAQRAGLNVAEAREPGGTGVGSSWNNVNIFLKKIQYFANTKKLTDTSGEARLSCPVIPA
jgi:hypothetical protein